MKYDRTYVAAAAGFVAMVLVGYVHAVNAAPLNTVYVHGARLNPDIVQVKVSLADLNLGSSAGAQMAFRRIQGAATTICGESPLNVDLDASGQYRRCLTAATNHGLSQLGDSFATALNRGHVSRPTILADR